MTVKEAIIKLLECDMESEIVTKNQSMLVEVKSIWDFTEENGKVIIE